MTNQGPHIDVPDAANPPVRKHTGEERRSIRDHDDYFNQQFDAQPIYVDIGGVNCATRSHDMLVSTVASGVLVTFYDSELKIGVMGHVILPDSILDCFPFLDQADPKLVEKAFAPLEECVGEMKNRGAGKHRLKIRLFGGVIRDDDPTDRGLKNTVFVQEYLFRKGLSVSNADIGGPFIRRVHFFPTTGRAVRRLLKRTSDFQDMGVLESKFNEDILSKN